MSIMHFFLYLGKIITSPAAAEEEYFLNNVLKKSAGPWSQFYIPPCKKKTYKKTFPISSHNCDYIFPCKNHSFQCQNLMFSVVQKSPIHVSAARSQEWLVHIIAWFLGCWLHTIQANAGNFRAEVDLFQLHAPLEHFLQESRAKVANMAAELTKLAGCRTSQKWQHYIPMHLVSIPQYVLAQYRKFILLTHNSSLF